MQRLCSEWELLKYAQETRQWVSLRLRISKDLRLLKSCYQILWRSREISRELSTEKMIDGHDHSDGHAGY